jgi:hypothetical protein
MDIRLVIWRHSITDGVLISADVLGGYYIHEIN